MESVELGANEITAFVVGSNVYRLLGTSHALEMLRRRRVDKFYIASACIALGKKLEGYNNSGQQIMIVDEGKNVTCIVAVENYTIVLITVLNKSNAYIKQDTQNITVVEKFGT